MPSRSDRSCSRPRAATELSAGAPNPHSPNQHSPSAHSQRPQSQATQATHRAAPIDAGRRLALRSISLGTATLSAGAAGSLLLGSGPAQAQAASSSGSAAGASTTTGAAGAAWPQRPIRIIHPWAAGGGGDIVTRVIADRMRLELGVPVLVENRPGAGGNLGAELASRQPPDGYTLMTTAGGFAIAPSLYRNLSYDAVKDFVPVTKIATAPLLVLVRADSPLRSMADLIALARKDPKGVTYGSFGNGSPSHLIGESINRLAGISMTHVPYTGGGAATDLMGGSLTLAILDAVSQTPQVKAGKLRALALNGNQRLPALPDVPTLIETGIPFDLVGWHAMFAPAGTPRDIVERLNKVVNQIIALPEIKARIFEVGAFPVQPPTSAEQWGAMFRQDVQAWGELVRRSGATIN